MWRGWCCERRERRRWKCGDMADYISIVVRLSKYELVWWRNNVRRRYGEMFSIVVWLDLPSIQTDALLCSV